MIIDGILLVLQGILNILLAPLTVLNITIDFIGSIPVVTQFLQIVAYMIPFDNLLPLIFLVVAALLLRCGIALMKFILNALPFF